MIAHRTFRRSATVFAALSLVTLATVSSADPKKPAKKAPSLQEVLAQKSNEQAKADYEASLVFAANSDFASAETRMQGAYDKTKDPRILYNLAVIQKKATHYTTAIRTLDRYIDLAKTDPEGRIADRDRADAEAFKKDLLVVTSPFDVEVVEKAGGKEVPVLGAKVVVDGEEIGVTPLPPTAKVNQRNGQLLRVTKDSFDPFEVKINVSNPQGHRERITLMRHERNGTLEVVLPEPYTVEVDGKVVGTGPVWSSPLLAGAHTLRVTAEGKKPYDARVDIAEGQTKRIELSKLEKNKSYTWVYIVSGAAVVAIVGGVVAYTTINKDPAISPPNGTLGSFNP